MGSIISAVVSDLLSRAISLVIDKYCRQQQGVEENLQQLHCFLLRIHTVVEEANGRSITNQAMLLQLKTMRDVMYRGYYFLDNFRHRIAPRTAQDEVGDHSLTLSPYSPLKRSRFSRITSKMVSEEQEKKELWKLLVRLECIISGMQEFVMLLTSYPRLIRQPYCNYLLLENCMFGRQAEQDRIISFLLESHPPSVETVHVLPIIGPIRVGKSTLVEHVCHDERVRKYFSTIVFYYCTNIIEGGDCMSPLPDININKQIKHQNPGSTKQSLSVIELADDTDEETCRRILHSLKGDVMPPVTKIIITSRSEKIATFGTTEALQLDFLQKEAHWYFFKTISFGGTNPEEEPKLASICMEIAVLLGGSFIGINMIGGILRSNVCVQFWYRLLERMKAITDRHFRLLGQHLQDAYAIKSGRAYMWSPKLNRYVAATYNLYEESSARLNDQPIVLASNIVTENNEPQEKLVVLQWQSSIPPYYSYLARYEMLGQPLHGLPKMKRSRQLSEGLL
uniref:Disease resistance N-terminal domain-containing protein n=1 Tax=Leersia perrieri TaxID=77586 RepID=A0A0D9VGP0_9ORYZ